MSASCSLIKIKWQCHVDEVTVLIKVKKMGQGSYWNVETERQKGWGLYKMFQKHKDLKPEDIRKRGRSGYWWSRRRRATGLQISSLLDWSVCVRPCTSMALGPRQVVPLFVPCATHCRGIASAEGTHTQSRLCPCTSASSFFLSIFAST